MPQNHPKISIVTPNFNNGAYLESTIQSVLGQGYPNLEYIIIDGGSTDNSIEIINKYKNQIHYFISEPDKGLYDAINKGFQQASGEIMGWLNSDDILLEKSLFKISKIFSTIPEASWITGIPVTIDKSGNEISRGHISHWSREMFLIGKYKWLQQESTFWRKSLWDKAGSILNTDYKLASDFELWVRFFRFAKLYSCDTHFAAFRKRPGEQLSSVKGNEYLEELEEILEQEIKGLDVELRKKLSKMKRVSKYITLLEKLFPERKVQIRNKHLRKHLNTPEGIYYNKEGSFYFLNH